MRKKPANSTKKTMTNRQPTTPDDMTHRTAIRFVFAATLLLLAVGCKSEKKITTYSSIYKERPVTLYVAPLQDKSQRREERYPQDIAFNAERNMAALHLSNTLSRPLTAKGYYVIPPLAAKQIAGIENTAQKELRDGDLLRYAQYYGVDAILLVTIHRWKNNENEVEIYLEYTLRSCKSNIDLMHSWVQANIKAEYNYKGEHVPTPFDRTLMQDYSIDAATALRCRLVERVSDLVLRNLPISASKRQFEQDRYETAHESYFRCVVNDNNEVEMEKISMEAFEEGCFVN